MFPLRARRRSRRCTLRGAARARPIHIITSSSSSSSSSSDSVIIIVSSISIIIISSSNVYIYIYVMDFRGFDSGRILIIRGGSLRWHSPRRSASTPCRMKMYVILIITMYSPRAVRYNRKRVLYLLVFIYERCTLPRRSASTPC